MTEFVSALFDFVPENDDELPLEIGERIEVLEKDQFHNDGWWTGRNASGRVGIFPANYAGPIATPPSPSELSSPDSATLQRQFDTLYDSIENHFTQTQSLTRKPTYASYISSDTEEEGDDRRASKGLRLKLALNARKARAEARHRQKEFGITTPLSPIDDSDSEDDNLESAQRHRIFESDDEGGADPFERILFRKPTRGKSLRRAATRRRPSVPDSLPALPNIPSELALVPFAAESVRTFSPEPIVSTHASVISGSVVREVPLTPTDATLAASTDKADSALYSPMRTASSTDFPLATRPVPSKTESLALSEYSILRAPSSKNRPKPPIGAPQSWTVSEVVVYLRSRGFAEDVCSCFEEQDIAGDVLAELNVANLESDIGISALGTRKRIIAALAELELPRSRLTPEPVVTRTDEPAKLEIPTARSLSPSLAVASLPTPEASPRKSSVEVLTSVSPSSSLREQTTPPPMSPPPTVAISSLPTPPEAYTDCPIMRPAPRSPEMLPASLTARRQSSTGALLAGPRPRPVSTSSALSATSMSSSSNVAHTQRPSISPPPASVGPSPPPSSSTNTFLPPGAARPRIPGAALPFEGLPPSLVPGGAARRPANAQHGRYASSAGPSTAALPAPVFRQQPPSTAVVNATAAPKVAQAHQRSASVTHITAALISGPFEVARATASAASGNKHLPDLLIPGRTRVGVPRGPRWHIRS
ncbi:hypothetical protein PENSPDRAFT_654567 [Peniophora sp. CONT]|nr:hypothetical protein PENSPDRAFT_654567 [Peniophora sp. CONT]